MALWGGRFTQAADKRFKDFNDSLRFDYRLAEQDIEGSIGWSKALVNVGVLSAEEQQQLEVALNELLIEVRSNPQLISTALFHLQNLPAPHAADVVLTGAEYSLYINADEVMAKANNLAIENPDTLEDGFYYYDDESIAFCGIEDFARFLHSYLDFIRA